MLVPPGVAQPIGLGVQKGVEGLFHRESAFSNVRITRDVINTQTQAEVETFIRDQLFMVLPRPPYTEAEVEEVAAKIYQHAWQRSANDMLFTGTAA